jgi:TRAP-type uncharacterized transport system substrate-binding protein
MPADAQTVALVRKNFVTLWSPSGLVGKSSKRKPAPNIKEIADLAGHKVGVIGRTPANTALLRLILSASGVQVDKIAVAQFGTDQVEELARDPTLDAFMAVGPLDSKITSDAIAATARSRGEPKFLAIEASEAIALKHPRYESEEIPPSVFNANPAWPDDKVETISVSHLIVARKALSETTVAAFFRQLFAVRQVVARQVPGAARITKHPRVNGQVPYHRLNLSGARRGGANIDRLSRQGHLRTADSSSGTHAGTERCCRSNSASGAKYVTWNAIDDGVVGLARSGGLSEQG